MNILQGANKMDMMGIHKGDITVFYVIITFSQRKLLALMKMADFNKDSQFTLKSPHLCLGANFFCLNVVKFLCFKSGWC